MRLLFRILVWVIALGATLSAAGLGLAWYLGARSLPDYDGQWRAEGLARPVEILRDSMATPHIFAETDADAFFALGWAHAQDRLWQMELSRRAAKGRLAELFGADAVSVDLGMRALDLAGLAQRTLAAQTPETAALLRAYADGVNARIHAVNEGALGRGAPEFFLFGDGRLAPWTAEDSLAIMKLMALRLTGAASAEARRARMMASLPADRLRDVLPDAPDATSLALPPVVPARPGRPTLYTPQGQGGASNAWAVSGERAASGAPLLAADPHLWLAAPGVWTLARLKSPGFDVIGASIPGIPAILMGRNPDFAWATATAQIDDQDLYLEELNPQDPTRYRTPQGWAEFDIREEVIRVAGRPDVRVALRRSRHGPVFPAGAEFDFSAIAPSGYAVALSWTALEAEDRSLDTALALMRAASVREGAEALADAVAPAQMVVMADRKDVGMAMAGAIPDRRPDSRSQGRLPSLGRYAENDWRGLLPPDRSLTVLRPASGAVAAANQRLTGAGFPRHLSFDWPEPYRYRRIVARLGERPYQSLESFAELQQDAVSEMARSVLPLIARDLWWGESPGDGPVERRRAAALERLADWNGEMSPHDPEPLIFHSWMRKLTRRLAEDELGAAYAEFQGLRPIFVERVFHDVDGAGRWCDVVKTPQTESCADIARLALDDALGELTERFGAGMEGWRWGEAHRIVHRHSPLGFVAGLGLLVNIDHEAPGDGHSIDLAAPVGYGPWPEQAIRAAGFRMVVDFADPDASLVALSTGASGHPLSRHYDDFGRLWRRGDYARLSLNREDARAGALGLTRIEPR